MSTDYSIKRFNTYTKEELILALQKLSKGKNSKFISGREFQEYTGVALTTIKSKFGSWKNFCQEAGLNPKNTFTTDRETLFENLENVWNKLGRQPRAREMKKPLSKISHSRYQREFGTWYNVCLQFLAWKSGSSAEEIEKESRPPLVDFEDAKIKHKTNRAISLSLRYKILKRDDFKCVKCGKSPATSPKTILHIDHIKPYSKGGETVLENLQTMCSDCNWGKSNRL